MGYLGVSSGSQHRVRKSVLLTVGELVAVLTALAVSIAGHFDLFLADNTPLLS